ncbi:unnamed protein product, partial [Clonostachys rosea]
RGLLAALFLNFLSPISALPARNLAQPPFQFNHSLSGTELADRAKSLSDLGYRITSFSAYGNESDPRYAAIWAEEAGRAQEILQDANYDTFTPWWQSRRANGYVMTHVSVTGPASNAVFAGVMEKDDGATNWQLECSLTNPWAFDNDTRSTPMTIKGFRMYGTPEDRRYCVLGHENVLNQQSTISYTTPTQSIDFDQIYAAETRKRFWRPSQLFMSNDHVITPSFTDTNVGSWVSYPSLTTADLDNEVSAQQQKGLRPISIQGGGQDSDVRFSVVFAENEVPEVRQWSVRGSVTGFKDNTAFQEKIDGIFQNWMVRNSIRQAQFSVALNGSTLAERSYTWAETDRAVVEPSDTFLLGSVTKMFTNQAIYGLVTSGVLNYSTTVFPLLGIQPADNRSNEITIQNVLEHRGGWDRSISGDPAFSFFQLAIQLFQGARALTLADFVEWMGTLTLDFNPGAYEAYSNIGTMLLGYIVTNVTGVSYLDYLKEHVFEGLDVKLYETDFEVHTNDRIVQESKFTRRDPVHPLSDALVPGPTGGDGAIKEETMGAFSLAASASSIAKFIGKHAVWGYGDRQYSARRDGSVVGARSMAVSRSDGIDWAVVLNTREYKSEDEWIQLTIVDIPGALDTFPIAT